MRLSASGGRLFAAAMIWISRAGRLGRAAIISVGGTRRHDVSLRLLPRGARPYLVANMRRSPGLVSGRAEPVRPRRVGDVIAAKRHSSWRDMRT